MAGGQLLSSAAPMRATHYPLPTTHYRFDFFSSCCLTEVEIAPVTFLLLASILSSDSRSSGTRREAKVNGVRGLLTRFSLIW